MKQQTIIFALIGIMIIAVVAVLLSGYQLPSYQGMVPTPSPPTQQSPPPTSPPTQPPEEQPPTSPPEGTPLTTPTPKTVDVEIINFAFSPATITIKVGDSIRWTNRDSVGHTATADDNGFDTGLLGNGQSGTITFDKAGTYNYHCTPHPWMKAKIIVE